MRVLFMGGKNIGCACLDYLVERKTNLVGIIVNTDTDVEANRWYRSATETGLRQNIPVFSPRNINSTEGVRLVKSLKPELIVVAYYDQILKNGILSIPKLGSINLHMALAEEYRGCYPTTWAIINGETRVGVTIHYVDEGIDSGDIIAQKELEIKNEYTGRDLYVLCSKAGTELFRETFPLIEAGEAPRRKQKSTANTKYYKREFPSREVDFTKSGKEIHNFIRALIFEPFPSPYIKIGERKFIFKEVKE